MKYLLLVYGCGRDGAPEDLDQKLAALAEFAQLCRDRGVFLAADPLHGPETATTVRVRDGRATVTDGPFAETAEWLGGYYLLDCRDLDEALEFAQRCPLAADGSVEVRPILEFD